MQEFLTNEYTETIQKVIQEIVNDPTTYRGAQYLPSVALPVQRIRTEVIEATGGLTEEHRVGTNPKYIQTFGTRVQEYTAPQYKEAIHYDEERILYLRELGANGRNVRGVQSYIDRDIDRLNRRIEARIEKQRWDCIFDGGFSWLGKTISFGIPADHTAYPISTIWNSGDNENDSADPVRDMRYWLMGGLDAFRKYKVTKIVMNPNTARWILDNNNTQTYLSSYGANPAIGSYDINRIMQFLIPGLPEIDVYDGWYQTESVDSNGKITVSDAQYFIDDGKIFFQTQLPGNQQIGEFVQGLHLATGTIENPGYGKFLLIDDNTQVGTQGGPKNPYVDIVGGVYGGVKLDRAFDVLTADVTTTGS
jgi:hypothetical protein